MCFFYILSFLIFQRSCVKYATSLEIISFKHSIIVMNVILHDKCMCAALKFDLTWNSVVC